MKMRAAPSLATQRISRKLSGTFSRGTISSTLLQTTTDALASGTGSQSLRAGRTSSSVALTRATSSPVARKPRATADTDRRGQTQQRTVAATDVDQIVARSKTHLFDHALVNSGGDFLFSRTAQC